MPKHWLKSHCEVQLVKLVKKPEQNIYNGVTENLHRGASPDFIFHRHLTWASSKL